MASRSEMSRVQTEQRALLAIGQASALVKAPQDPLFEPLDNLLHLNDSLTDVLKAAIELRGRPGATAALVYGDIEQGRPPVTWQVSEAPSHAGNLLAKRLFIAKYVGDADIARGRPSAIGSSYAKYEVPSHEHGARSEIESAVAAANHGLLAPWRVNRTVRQMHKYLENTHALTDEMSQILLPTSPEA